MASSPQETLQKIASWTHDCAITHDSWRGSKGLSEFGPLGGVQADWSCLMSPVWPICTGLKQMKEKFLPLLCPCFSRWFSLNHQSGSYIGNLPDLISHAWASVTTQHPTLCSPFPEACLSPWPRLTILLLTSKDKCGPIFQSHRAELINFGNQQHEDSSQTFRYEQQ